MMEKNQLTLLGCSSSLAFMLLISNSALASEVPPQDIRVVEFKAPEVQTVNAPVPEEYLNSQ